MEPYHLRSESLVAIIKAKRREWEKIYRDVGEDHELFAFQAMLADIGQEMRKVEHLVEEQKYKRIHESKNEEGEAVGLDEFGSEVSPGGYLYDC